MNYPRFGYYLRYHGAQQHPGDVSQNLAYRRSHGSVGILCLNQALQTDSQLQEVIKDTHSKNFKRPQQKIKKKKW
jgi:hypothetical protein